MKVKSTLILVLSALMLLFAVSARASGPYVKGLTWSYEERALVTSFGVGDALNRPDMKEAIMSTRPVSLTFTAEVVKHRTLWKDKVVASKVVVHTVRYDNLTRQYTVETAVNGKIKDKRTVATWEEMAQYMENIHDLHVTSVANLEPSEGAYSLRVRVHVMSNFVLWIIPWDIQTPWVSQTLATP